MLGQDSMAQLKEAIEEYGGQILWTNIFNSWDKKQQEEMISYLWGFIIYAQTLYYEVQPVWVAFEHKFSTKINTFVNAMSLGKYYIKKYPENIVHTVFQIRARELFKTLRTLKQHLEVHDKFQEVPDHKLFRFLNSEELFETKNDSVKKWELVANKLNDSSLGYVVPTVRFIPDPVFCEIKG